MRSSGHWELLRTETSRRLTVAAARLWADPMAGTSAAARVAVMWVARMRWPAPGRAAATDRSARAPGSPKVPRSHQAQYLGLGARGGRVGRGTPASSSTFRAAD